jgi:hypothetical protein
MADDIPPYPFFQPPSYTQPFEPAPYQPVSVPQAHVETQTKLICDYCKEPIVEGDEAINGLYGTAGKGRKSGRLMVMPDKNIPEGEFNIHIICVSGFVEENLPEAADEIRQMEYEPGEDVELFCAACDAKIEDENVG